MIKNFVKYGLQCIVLVFFFAATVYSAALLPKAIARLIERGPDHPKFWSHLCVIFLVSLGIIFLALAVIYVIKGQVSALMARRKNKGFSKGQVTKGV